MASQVITGVTSDRALGIVRAENPHTTPFFHYFDSSDGGSDHHIALTALGYPAAYQVCCPRDAAFVSSRACPDTVLRGGERPRACQPGASIVCLSMGSAKETMRASGAEVGACYVLRRKEFFVLEVWQGKVSFAVTLLMTLLNL